MVRKHTLCDLNLFKFTKICFDFSFVNLFKFTKICFEFSFAQNISRRVNIEEDKFVHIG